MWYLTIFTDLTKRRCRCQQLSLALMRLQILKLTFNEIKRQVRRINDTFIFGLNAFIPKKISPARRSLFAFVVMTVLRFSMTIKFNFNHNFLFLTERIAKGEKNVLTSQEPWMLAVTSGTTGKSCLIPKTRDNSKTFVEYGFAVGVYYTMYNVLPQVSQHIRDCM